MRRRSATRYAAPNLVGLPERPGEQERPRRLHHNNPDSRPRQPSISLGSGEGATRNPTNDKRAETVAGKILADFAPSGVPTLGGIGLILKLPRWEPITLLR